MSTWEDGRWRQVCRQAGNSAGCVCVFFFSFHFSFFFFFFASLKNIFSFSFLFFHFSFLLVRILHDGPSRDSHMNICGFSGVPGPEPLRGYLAAHAFPETHARDRRGRPQSTGQLLPPDERVALSLHPRRGAITYRTDNACTTTAANPG